MNKKRGFSLVEVLVMVFIATFCIFVIWRVYILYIKISQLNPSTFQASFLAEEGIEAIKFMRDNGWNSNIATLSTTTPYTLTFDGAAWGVTTTPIFIAGQFDRRVSLGDVYRDMSGDIASSGSFDPGTRKITITVAWQIETSTTTHQITTYVSNIFVN